MAGRTCRYDRGSAGRTPRSAASPCQDGAAWSCPSPPRHCEGRRPAAIQNVRKTALDCFASLAMTSLFLRSEEHTSELQSLMRISYAVFCLKKKKTHIQHH